MLALVCCVCSELLCDVADWRCSFLVWFFVVAVDCWLSLLFAAVCCIVVLELFVVRMRCLLLFALLMLFVVGDGWRLVLLVCVCC